MAPALAHAPFHRDGWIYEEKVDGWRLIVCKDGPRVRLISRNAVDHTTPGQLAHMLLKLYIQHKTEAAKREWEDFPAWVFCTEAGTMPDESRVRTVVRKALKAVGLPLHFSPHCLRHTFASLLQQQGESPAYVQRQLGHASIQLTVDTYRKWLPMGNKAAVNRLHDEKSGSSKNGDGHFRCAGSARQQWWAVKDSNLGPAG
jgi:integrase